MSIGSCSVGCDFEVSESILYGNGQPLWLGELMSKVILRKRIGQDAVAVCTSAVSRAVA